jgi:hypothetical protein
MSLMLTIYLNLSILVNVFNKYLVSDERVFKDESDVHVEMVLNLLLLSDDLQLLLRVQTFNQFIGDVLLRRVAQDLAHITFPDVNLKK